MSKFIFINCPNCKKKIFQEKKFPFRPFCSKRCQLIDLGDWIDERKRIFNEISLTEKEQIKES